MWFLNKIYMYSKKIQWQNLFAHLCIWINMNVSVNKWKFGVSPTHITTELWKKYFLLCTYFNTKYHTLLQISQRNFNIKYPFSTNHAPAEYSFIHVPSLNNENTSFLLNKSQYLRSNPDLNIWYPLGLITSQTNKQINKQNNE